MSHFFPCPSCHFVVQPPKKASANARLRCPVCQHEILAGDLLQGTHRQWVVIDDPGGEDLFYAYHPAPILAEQAPLRFEAESTSETADNEGDELVLEDTGDQVDLADNGKGTTVDWKKFKPITHDEFQRRKRATKPAWMTLVQIVLGGAAAIPVSLLIIWHVLGKDIGGAGPMVGQIAPWAVPKKFRPAKEVPEAFWENPKPVPQLDRPSKLPRAGGLPDRSDFGKGEKESPVERPQIALDSEGKTEGNSEPASKLPAEESPNANNQSSEEAESGEKSDQAASELSLAIESLTKSQSEWQSYQGEDRTQKRALAQQFYKSLGTLAEVLPSKMVAFSPERVWKNKAESVCKEILNDSSLVSLIDQGSQASLRQPAENLSSLATLAVVNQMAATGDEFLLAISPELMHSEQVIPTVLYPPFDRDVEIGRRSLLLGKFENAHLATDAASGETGAPPIAQRVFRVTLIVPVPIAE